MVGIESSDPRAPVMAEVNKVLGLMEAFSSQQVAVNLQELEDRIQQALEDLERGGEGSSEQETTPSTDKEDVAMNTEPSTEKDSEGVPVSGSTDDAAASAASTAPEDTELSTGQVSSLLLLLEDTKTTCQGVVTKHRELHKHLSNIGKQTDKNFDCSYEYLRTVPPFLRADTRPLLQEAVCNHLCRSGMQHVADLLVKESSLGSAGPVSHTFTELYGVVAALRRRELGPLDDWVQRHRLQLEERKSPLEFSLRHMQFAAKLQRSPADIAGAVQFARTHLQPFVETHEKAIAHAMGALVFHGSRQELLSPQHWEDLCDTFVKDACKLLGLSLNSPLSLCVKAGCVALPSLHNIRSALSGSQAASLMEARQELPLHIDLGPGCQFHSTFTCPILRMQSHDSNPPMRLHCGHVISKDALNRFATQSKKASGRIKCPYCPLEQDPKDTIQLCF